MGFLLLLLAIPLCVSLMHVCVVSYSVSFYPCVCVSASVVLCVPVSDHLSPISCFPLPPSPQWDCVYEGGQILGARSLGYLEQEKELRFQELQPSPGSPAPPFQPSPQCPWPRKGEVKGSKP